MTKLSIEFKRRLMSLYVFDWRLWHLCCVIAMEYS